MGITGRLLIAAAVIAAMLPGTARAQIAVITNTGNPLSTIGFDDLRRLFIGQTARLNGSHVSLVESVTTRQRFYRTVAQMSEAQVDRAWLAVVFQGGDATPPRKLATPEEVRRFVAEHAEAIGFVPADAVDATVKVVRINGLLPTQAGYPIP